jgi:hypothetical protein
MGVVQHLDLTRETCARLGGRIQLPLDRQVTGIAERIVIEISGLIATVTAHKIFLLYSYTATQWSF